MEDSQASRMGVPEHRPVRDMAAIAASCSPQGSICSPPGTAERHGTGRASQGPSWGTISTEGKANASHQAPISTSVMGEATSPEGLAKDRQQQCGATESDKGGGELRGRREGERRTVGLMCSD